MEKAMEIGFIVVATAASILLIIAGLRESKGMDENNNQ